MAYVDYNYYKNSFGGTAVPEENFLNLSVQASAFIDYITFNRLKGESVQISDEVKMATCAVMDEIKKINDNGGIKSSESIGDYSVSYANVENSSKSEYKVKYSAAALYLGHTGLLYRGVR